MVRIAAILGVIKVMMGEKFFNSCLVHDSQKKNEKNTFCLDCCITLCFHCLPSHKSHHLLQVRRYVYQDVLRLKDAEKLMDCSSIQSYITNNAKVVFLKQRPISRQFKVFSNICTVCDRNLQDPYLFCSIFCKVNYNESNSRKKQLYKCDCLIELQGCQMTPNSVLKPSTSMGSSSSTDYRILNAKISKQKRTSSMLNEGFTLAINRRKRVPHRSPLW